MTSGMARQCAAAVGFALLFVVAVSPATHADGENPPIVEVIPAPLPPGDLPPVEGETPPVEGETPPVEGETPPVEGETPPVEGETPPVEGETPPTGGDPLTPPQVPPAGPDVPPADNSEPADSELAPAEVPMRLRQSNTDGPAVDGQEAVPATGEATPTPAPSMTSEAPATAVPMALPLPVAKTIDAVVATATGSPLYVQFLTVLVLIGAGIAYFRFLASKGTHVPSKPVK